ncbi:LOW QUALITY PROTEIN: mixed lineage kinase domain-like protein [Pelmatolapia mariae]|uniref:LOW QUALITY PROTEIN: mixed lineage kinase domain-like protein n=1 Tax=Pelmatolapia mariae TaxID=158779 RepID=UPI002FE50C6D
METVKSFFSAATNIYKLAKKVKANKKRCQRISVRVKAFEGGCGEVHHRVSPQVEKALGELTLTLDSAQKLIEKYTAANLVERILKSGSHGEEFNTVSERHTDAYQVLCVALQSEQREMLYEVFKQREKEDEMDGKEDDTEMTKLLMDYIKEQQEKTNTILRQLDKVVQMLNKPSFSSVAVRQIKPHELKYEHPKKPFKITASSELYKGEYQGFPVAIKRYINPMNTSARFVPQDVKSIFNKEVDTMKQFESPNILRMFGICIQDENGPNPQFFIIMEYCEKGSLRQVLDSDYTLTWIRTADMCLDAARGLYRFGIILWEIVTCKNPFEGFSDEEIYQKVCKEKYREPLPDDCPAELGQLINECRAYDGFQRPSAGVLLDKLRSVVTQMEEQQD